MEELESARNAAKWRLMAGSGAKGNPKSRKPERFRLGRSVDGTSGKHPEFKGNVATVYTHDMAQGGGPDGSKAEAAIVRGNADSIALRIACHDTAIDTTRI